MTKHELIRREVLKLASKKEKFSARSLFLLHRKLWENNSITIQDIGRSLQDIFNSDLEKMGYDTENYNKKSSPNQYGVVEWVYYYKIGFLEMIKGWFKRK